MKRRVENWSLKRVYKERAAILFPEYQRQPNLWSLEARALLIDSILQDIDIPKLYFNHTGDGYEVVDGQQRLWAIWDFLDNQITLRGDNKQKYFKDLSRSQRETIANYVLQVVVFSDAEDDYLRNTFLRLQLGQLLVIGEKLNAIKGEMKKFVFQKMVRHSFFSNIGIPARRFAKETLAAQICINSFSREKSGKFSRTRHEDLQQFFKDYENPRGIDFKVFKTSEKRIIDTMNKLAGCVQDRANQWRNRAYILSVYLLFEDLLKGGQLTSKKDKDIFASFAVKLWRRSRDEIKAGMDRTNRELYEFETLISSAPGEKYQIERRHNKMMEYFDYFKRRGKIKAISVTKSKRFRYS